MHNHSVPPSKKLSATCKAAPRLSIPSLSQSSNQIYSASAARNISEIPDEQLLTRYEQLQNDIVQLHTSLDAIEALTPRQENSELSEPMSSQQAVDQYCGTFLATQGNINGPPHDNRRLAPPARSLQTSPSDTNDLMSSQQAVDHHFTHVSDHNIQAIPTMPQPTDNG